MKEKRRICFVSLYSYPLFNPSSKELFGGSEIRSYLFGKGLSELQGYEVFFIVFNHKQPKAERYGKMWVIRHSYYKKFPILSELYQREADDGTERGSWFLYMCIGGQWLRGLIRGVMVRSLRVLASPKRKVEEWLKPPLRIGDYYVGFEKIRIYQEIDADVYCVFGVSNLAAEIAAFCKQFGKLFVLFAGSGADCSEEYINNPEGTNPYGSVNRICHYAIKQSDVLVTQTHTQREVFRDRFEKESEVILNPIDLSRSEKCKENVVNYRHALWIGKANKVKRPEVVIELALQFSEIRFVMILNFSDASIYRRIIASKPENVEIIERCSLKYAEKLFSSAFVLINTSVFEGFPNTFLQAGKYGIPILSLLVNPDNFLRRFSCGIVAEGQFDKLSDGLRIISSDQELWRRFSKNIRKYVSEYHDISDKIEKLDKLFRGICERTNSAGI